MSTKQYTIVITPPPMTYLVDAESKSEALLQAHNLYCQTDLRVVGWNRAIVEMSNAGRYMGIHAYIRMGEPFDGERYISFGEYEEYEEKDSFGVPDDDIFYYFDAQQRDWVLEAIADGVDAITIDGYTIDLSKGYTLETAL